VGGVCCNGCPICVLVFNVFIAADDFYNKPWGLKHWLENASPPVPEDAIVALLDPDMVLMRPITPIIKGQPYLVSKRISKNEASTTYLLS
jgi:hypothetical protein